MSPSTERTQLSAGPLRFEVTSIVMVAIAIAAPIDPILTLTRIDGGRVDLPHLYTLTLLVVAVGVAVTHRARPARSTVAMGATAAATIAIPIFADQSPELRRILDYLVLPITVVAVVSICRIRANARMVVIGLATGATLAAVWALVMHATGDAVLLDEARMPGSRTLLVERPRLTWPWPHANVAAMYLAPAAAGAAVAAAMTDSRRRAALTFVAVVTFVALLLTVSRAGVISAIVVVAIVIAVATSWRWALATLGIAALLVVAAVAMSDLVRDRWIGIDRYSANVVAPSTLTIDEPVTVEIGVTNDSDVRWDATGDRRVMVSARWRDDDQSHEWLTQTWALPHDLLPGQTIQVAAQVPAQVPDGRYTVVWDLLRDREAFFQQSAGTQTVTSAVVSGSSSTLAGAALSSPAQLPGRRLIWEWSVELIAEEPLVGHGLGAFPFVVNSVKPAQWRGAAHAHNLLLESLVAVGLIGTVPLVVGLVTIGRRMWSVHSDQSPAVIGGAAAILVLVLQSAVEWPLQFGSVSLGAGLLIGGWWALSTPGRHTPSLGSAHQQEKGTE